MAVLLRREMIQRSCSAVLGPQASPPAESTLELFRTSEAGGGSCGPSKSNVESTDAPSELSRQNRAAFQILFAKFRYDSTCFSFQRISVVPTCARVRRVASTP